MQLCSIYPDSIRLDRFLKLVFGSGLKQSVIEKGCRKKQIRINQKPAEAKTRVTFGDEVYVMPSILINLPFDHHDTADSLHSSYDEQGKHVLRVVYDHPDFCVIYKPYGLASQGGPGITESVAETIGRNNWLVHRLDRNTEGLMLIAKNRVAAAKLANMFQQKQIQKYYYAIVRGCPPQESGIIDVPLKNICVEGEDRMVVDRDGQKAVTHYQVIKRLNTHHALVLLKPLTGRKHQLRVHMHYLGTPILGDMKYGKRAKRMHLYACMMEFMWNDENISVHTDTISSINQRFLPHLTQLFPR